MRAADTAAETLAADAANLTRGGREASASCLRPGEMLDRYCIRSVLGHGGMGTVYLAHDAQLDRLVALKVPKLEKSSDPTLAERFNREARAAATLRHPHICPIFDIGEHEGVPFIAMAYIDGRPLTAYIKSDKRQPERQAAMAVRKIALALHEAHALGIVHRDLKPANIMIDRRGDPIVMDFGLARYLDDNAATRLTQEGTMVGTPAYMAPEQIDDRAPIGPAADVYSLGVVLYELLTGRCPFQGSMPTVIGQVLHVEPAPVAKLRPDVTPALSAICQRAIAKQPEERFATMKEFARALTAYLKGEVSAGSSAALEEPDDSLPMLQPVHEDAPATRESDPPLLSPVAEDARRRRSTWLIAAAAALLLAVLLAIAAVLGFVPW